MSKTLHYTNMYFSPIVFLPFFFLLWTIQIYHCFGKALYKSERLFVPCSITTVVYFYTFGFYIPCLVTSTWCFIIYAQCSCVKLFYNKCKDKFTTCLLTKVFKLTKGSNKIFGRVFMIYFCFSICFWIIIIKLFHRF